MHKVCLVMIVKNEAHIITDTLRHLLNYVPIDTWSICDTGSTDSTKEDITRFFAERGIPGQIHETEWRDFGHNRSVAFAKAAGFAEYSFVWDADDTIEGNFVFPTDLKADWYKFMFGNKSGFRYSRCQLFHNRKPWKYVGVLHEYPSCAESCDSPVEVKGDYYFVSGRSGARNKNPMKYQDDARILEAAYKKAVEEKDPIHCRYAFYCAQSYASANMPEKAAEFYKIVLTLDNWYQEKYMSCLSLYNHLTTLGKEQEGLFYLVEAFQYDRTRAECIYRLVKYYCIKGLPEVALAYYGLFQNYYETEYPRESGGRERLFANMDEYDFYLPYYMIIVADRTKRHDIAAKMYDIIFTKRFTGTTKWWIDNLFTNAQFCYHAFPKTTEFLGKMFDYVNDLRARKIYLDPKHNAILTKIVEAYTPVLCAARPDFALGPFKPVGAPRVMLTMTSCKRLALFRKTVCSILNTWTDVGLIDAFFCVDDNSSEEDRAAMRAEFPFFEYHMKGPAERGHKESMNIIWEKLHTVKPTYWIHLEDDWMYFHHGSYVERGMKALDTYKDQHIHQVVFNRNYGVVYNDLERTGGFEQADRIILHELNPNLAGRHSGYWPHYSLQPSICRTETILQLGNYTTAHRFFERGYAEKYNAAGHKTAFFDSVYSTHIGKQHWETEGQNAYALNEVSQFQAAPTHPSREPNEPLVGSMAEHLDQIIGKIRSKRPFGLIRPSDGEYAILQNRTLTNCDAWTWRTNGSLREQLAESVRTVDPNLYIGIPCNSCKKPWNCTEEIHTDFLEKFRVRPPQITYANIFMNSNWAKWTEFIRNYPGALYFVGSGKAESSLQIKGRHEISPTLVNSWETDGETETARILEFIRDIRGELICFAAGPLSKVWIPLCMKQNPTNMYVDVGASLDIFTKGATNRMYISPSHPFAKEACVFRRQKKPNLLYFCVFHNRDYCKLARLLLISMRLHSSMEAFDILVMTTEEFRKEFEALAKELRISVQIYTLPLKTVFEAACARLKVFDWGEISTYKNILYLDTDIVIKGSLDPLFQIPTEDKLYAIQSGTIASRNFGRDYFKGWVDFSKTGFNSGTLLFQNSARMRELFANVWTHAMEHASSPPACMDQPFLNYHAIKYDLYDNTALNPFVSLYEDNDIVTNEATSVLSHFSFPIGNFAHKYERMTVYFQKGLARKEEGATASLVGKSYSWESAHIVFRVNGALETTWGKGTYEVLDNNRVKASWNGFDHYLTLFHNGSEYLSVRTKPGDYGVVFGTLQTIAGETPEYPVILHTCDKYERFWNHWYFFFRKYVSGVSKVYFLTEEKEPVFSDEVTVIKTGGGPWGKRLLTAFEQISEPYVYYMQEDFWASQAFNPSIYVPTFFQYRMDALRITNRSPLYSLDMVNGLLYRFKQKSHYLMTHQFSLWKRDYFLRWIGAEDEPWENEMEQSVKIANTKHAIYLIDSPWYEATVRRGNLQPNGQQLLDAHSEEIAKSFVNNH